MDNESTRRWAVGIPSADELSPLNTSLITPVLACAFNLNSESGHCLTEEEVQEAAERTVRGTERVVEPPPIPIEDVQARPQQAGFSGGGWQQGGMIMPGRYSAEEASGGLEMLQGVHGNMPAYGGFGGGKENSMDSGGKKARPRPTESLEGEEDIEALELTSDEPPGRALKRPRLVWTPQLHKRFCDAVDHLGVDNAVPKTIMQLMNVEGLTRENVASHLQKYRLYLRQRFQNEGVAAPSSSDPMFAAGPEPSRAGPSAGPSPAASGEGGGSGERFARVKGHGMGLSISGLEGGPSQQDVGYRDHGGYLGSRQLAGRPAAEHLELDTFGRPLKRANFTDDRGLAANGPLR